MDKQAVSELLKKARKVIELPEYWTKGEFARDSSMNRASPLAEGAVCFCSLGAIKKVDQHWSSDAGRHAVEALRVTLGWDVGRFNDTHTHAEVLAAWDAAIASLETEPPGVTNNTPGQLGEKHGSA